MSASITLRYLQLAFTNHGNYYTFDTPFDGVYTVTDGIDNGGGDNLNQLGDVSGDHFILDDNGASDPATFDFLYIGKVVGGNGIVMQSTDSQPQLFVLSDRVYPGPANYQFSVDHSAFALCFATGTLIQTARGEVAVEDLREGEAVITASGEARAIKWIGHRRTDCAHHPKPKDVWPVLVEAGALGNNTPERDLYLTPYHAVAMTCGSDVLVPVHALINGDTIRQVPVDEITYWHVELDSHDILIANGARAESFLDTGNRAGFENADGVMQLHPSFEAGRTGGFCLPMVESGPVIAAIRANLPVRKIAA